MTASQDVRTAGTTQPVTPDSRGVREFSGTRPAQSRSGLRVLMLSPQPFFRARGTPFCVLHRIRGLLDAGHQVDLIAYPFGSDVPLPELHVTRCSCPPFVKDVGIGPSLAKLGLDFALYLKARRMIRNQQYDVVHSHEEAAFFGVGLARRHGLPHVYDMHSSLPQQLSNFRAYNWGLLRGVFSRLERYALENSTAVITVCPDLEDIVDRVCPGAVHTLIENTADDVEVFGADQKDIRQKWGLGGKKVILYTGTLEPYQGIDLLISAMPDVKVMLPEAHLLIVGGTARQIQHFRKMVADSGLDDTVTFVGTRPPSDMPSYTAAADVIVSPRSRGTNTPAKIYGYLRTGKPLVATDLLTHTQVLDPSVSHLVPASPIGLRDGLIKVLSDHAYAKKIAAAALERAEERFADSDYLAKVGDFYERIRDLADGNTRLEVSRR